MVKKLIATLDGFDWPNIGRPGDNEHLFQLLSHYRGLIGDNFTNKKWDRHKKLANEYELVYTMFFGYPSICQHAPISRSFFKMWEIMYDFAKEMPFLSQSDTSLRAVFLAEGPGGFMEAVMKLRKNPIDVLCGMTLMSSDSAVPKWKSDRLLTDYSCNVCFEPGVDGTGSLYNLENIDQLVHNMGVNSCQLVTADGGFDFSTDFNNQERLSQRLIACEVYAALKLQAHGGAFVLKIYDIHHPITFQLMWILKTCYHNVSVHKPLTSRPANSEKYLVCSKFCGASQETLDSLNTFCTSLLPSTMILPSPPHSFLQSVVSLNHYFVLRQIVNISNTLVLIKRDRKEVTSFKPYVKDQLTKAVRWCNKYQLPINFDSLKEYKSFVRK